MKPSTAVAERYMARALALARRAYRQTWPNPMVGAVVVRGGRIVGEGYHHRPGLAHAEVEALERAGRRALGADLYVTLEPCHCFGRTGPCTSSILESGIRRVFVGATDPNPRECGGGLHLLRHAGVKVIEGVLEDQCQKLNEDYNLFIREGRPLVVLKAAISLDGRIGTAAGTSRWLTGERARREAHRLRTTANAVLVGAGTVTADDPELTVRHVRGPNPAVVVLDGKLSLSPRARLLHINRGAPVWVFCAASANARKRRALESTGAKVVALSTTRGSARLNLNVVLRELFNRGVYRLLVEGGSEVHGAFMSQRLVDRLELFIAPLLLGSEGVPLVRWKGLRTPEKAPRLVDVRFRQIGNDAHCSGRLCWP
jgi:diaminohydroxyphosphoribosylaminopyrimidine deaminase/5-amino-6-(5-phosphoribosylamino)uracil reductase